MVINVGRSVPFIILLIILLPFTRLIVGTTLGTTAAIVPLAMAAIPFVARLTANALAEIPTGLTESAHAMGATNWQIITKYYFPESLPILINAITLTLVSLIGYSQWQAWWAVAVWATLLSAMANIVVWSMSNG